jgi:aminopeptidase
MAARVDERLERYADLAVRVGANVQEGQTVFLWAELAHAPLARALARAAYRAGARYVDMRYVDPHIRKAMIELGPDEALSYTPDWLKTWGTAQENQASIVTTGDPEPDLLADLDGERVGRARMQELVEIHRKQLVDRSVNWSIVAFPNAGWAAKIFGDANVERLWELVAECTRLDADDPVGAWHEHLRRLDARAARLNELGFQELRYRGPGTDFTIGLNDDARWMPALFRTRNGVEFVPNLPTEEIFTTPDWRRAEGTISSTRPLALLGDVIEGLRLTVRDGRIVAVDADHGAGVVRGQIESDERAAYFGEVALVDGTSRVGQTHVTYFDTLYDENATSHIAYGFGIPEAFEGEPGEGMNVANVHTDFMVGGPELELAGVTADGSVVSILREEEWQLPE